MPRPGVLAAAARRPTRAFTLLELLVVICLIGACAVVAPAVFRHATREANLAVQRQNQLSLQSAIELFQAQADRYPAALSELLETPPWAVEASQDQARPLLSQLPVQPTGHWQYNPATGQVSPVDDSPAGAPTLHSITYQLASLASQSLAFLLVALPTAGAVFALALGRGLAAAVTRLHSLRPAWAWTALKRDAWLAIYHNPATKVAGIEQVVTDSGFLLICFPSVVCRTSSRLIAAMTIDARRGHIPLHLKEQEAAKQTIYRIRRELDRLEAARRQAGRTPSPAATKAARAFALLLSFAGAGLAVQACHVLCRPFLSDAAALLLVAPLLFLAAALLPHLIGRRP